MSDTALEVRRTAAPTFLPGEHESARIWKLAQAIATTDFVPRSLRGNPPAIMAAMLTGRELGIMPMRALRQVNVIDGQPSPSPELMMALALKAGHEVDVIETSRTRCVVEVRRAEWPDDRRRRLEWSIDDAVAAGLCTVTDDGQVRARSSSGKPLPWETYTRAMLRSRAVSEACRTWLPDVVDGASYVPEELGAEVNRDGHAQELVDAAEARGDTYDPLDGEPDEVRTAVAAAMGADDPDGEVVDAEIVDDEPEPANPESEPDVEVDAPHPDGWDVPEQSDEPPVAYDWDAHRKSIGLGVGPIIAEIIRGWPDNFPGKKPSRAADLDAFAIDPIMGPILRAAIDNLAKGR